jgi:trimeric autotransporter adhesin
MKTPLLFVLAALFSVTFNQSVSAQGSAFTYQGRLNTNGAPYSGAADFQFTLWDSLSGGNAVATNNPASLTATLTGGLFTVTLDFGVNSLNGQPRFLQTEVRTVIGPFTALNPRQPITATPYALRALNLSTNGLASGTYGSAVTFDNAANSFAGAFSGNGSALASVNAATLDGLSSAGFWKTNGNTGANPTNGAFLGTSDRQPLELKVNGFRALRIEYATNLYGYNPNMIAGNPFNMVSNGFVGAVIGGGGYSLGPNRVGADWATVVGGLANTASGNYSLASGYASIASGRFSTAMGNSPYASGYASIAMGEDVEASGDRSLAMGRYSRALHDGSFVWADSQSGYFASTTSNQFNVRADGGVRFSDDTPSLSFGSAARQMIDLYGTNYGIGVQSSTTYFRSNSRFSWFRDGTHSDSQNDPGAGGVVAMTLTSSGLTVNGVVVSSSDRNLKAGFTPVDAKAILEKVAALPIQRWHFTNDASTPHLGPVAQDFYAAFNAGADDKHIATVDADGVALAAIQGLNQKLTDELKRRDAENTALKSRLTALEKLITQRDSKGN